MNMKNPVAEAYITIKVAALAVEETTAGLYRVWC
jgi:hypothetical protein